MSETIPQHLGLWDIPSNWAWTTTGEICSIIGGGTPRTDDSSNFDGGEIPWITPADLSGYSHKVIEQGARNITERGLSSSGATMMPAGTVLFSSRAPIGYVAIATIPVSTNQGFKSFSPSPAITSDFLYYYLQFAKPIARALASGTTFLEISGAKAAQIPVPLAPRAEQSRIVAEIEKQFTRLDAATAVLKRAQANLKRYRASVLKAACEGRLVSTEAELARNEGRNYESGAELLKRILKERRARWEADTLAKMVAGGKPPTDDRWKQKYKEPSAPDPTFHFDLPAGWCLASMDQLTSRITSGSRDWTPYYGRGSGVFVMAQNVRPGCFDTSMRQSVDPPKDDSSILRSQIETNDLLVTIVGANTGDVCRVPGNYPKHYVCQSVALMRPALSFLSSYLEYYLNAPEHGQSIYKTYIYGAGRPHLSFDQLQAVPVLLPPESEISRITDQLAKVMPMLDRQNGIVSSQLARTPAIRGSILKSAFSGKLVPQDPTDEPASVLLERIRAERRSTIQKRADRRRKQELAAV